MVKSVDNHGLYGHRASSANEHATGEVRAITSLKIRDLKDWLDSPAGGMQVIYDRAHIFFAAKQNEQFQKDPKQISVTPPTEPPDGPPIGTDNDWDGWD